MLDTRFLARNLTKDSTGYQRHLVENPFDGGGDALNGFDRYGRQGYLLDGGNAMSRAIFLGEIVEEGLSASRSLPELSYLMNNLKECSPNTKSKLLVYVSILSAWSSDEDGFTKARSTLTQQSWTNPSWQPTRLRLHQAVNQRLGSGLAWPAPAFKLYKFLPSVQSM